MKQLKRWMRIVGSLYVINGLALFVLYLNEGLQETLVTQAVPGADPDHPLAQWGLDIWLLFGFEMLVVGATLFVASRNAWSNRIIVFMVLGLEFFRGVVDDVVWIASGYPPPIYIGWIIFHTAVIVTGVLALRRASRESSRHETMVPA